MRGHVTGLLVVVALVAGGCGGASGPEEPPAVQFTAVELPGGAMPVTLAAAGDTLLVGVRRDGQAVVPGLYQRGPAGAMTEIPTQGVSPYGRLARWRSITSDGKRILAVGGEHGGAHGHVRWSVWSGSLAGLAEQPQGFSTFGGYEAGELVGAVLTPAGGALVGSWASARLGFDVAVWTADGAVWTRRSSAGTALESASDSMGFPLAATEFERGVLVAGWRVVIGSGGGQQPVVWRSAEGNTGWSVEALPDAGKAGAAVAARCWGGVCGVAGRVDGRLAVWRLENGEWARLAGAPPVGVGERDRLAAPVDVYGRLTQVVSDGGQVRVASVDGDRWTVRAAAGPAGMVTAAVRVGDSLYVLAGPDEDAQALWRADAAAVG